MSIRSCVVAMLLSIVVPVCAGAQSVATVRVVHDGRDRAAGWRRQAGWLGGRR